MLTYTNTPVQTLHHPLFEKHHVHVSIKREDLNHPYVSGNKWWKLKFNLEEAKKTGHHTLLTFGGAHSNHIYASAAAAKEVDLKAIGIIRGEELSIQDNATLRFAHELGMHLHFVSREDYRKKAEPAYLENLIEEFGRAYIIPEGGTNELAVCGVEAFGLQLKKEVEFDYLCCAVGTGGTLAGLIKAVPDKKLIGFSSLKGSFLEAEVKNLLKTENSNWSINNDYHFGGYARYDTALMNFILKAEKDFNMPLEQVYTGKMFFGVLDLIEKKYFPAGSKIMLLHTGGLQGKIG
jgi:1-aminocyclopropane-1-carboxylate deaminase/D-cysteine desulfhydrase-like pyridoxal-dependent ACC family enzyme